VSRERWHCLEWCIDCVSAKLIVVVSAFPWASETGVEIAIPEIEQSRVAQGLNLRPVGGLLLDRMACTVSLAVAIVPTLAVSIALPSFVE
jgi:hypothetical protein